MRSHIRTLNASQIGRAKFQIDEKVVNARGLTDALGIQMVPAGWESVAIFHNERIDRVIYGREPSEANRVSHGSRPDYDWVRGEIGSVGYVCRSRRRGRLTSGIAEQNRADQAEL